MTHDSWYDEVPETLHPFGGPANNISLEACQYLADDSKFVTTESLQVAVFVFVPNICKVAGRQMELSFWAIYERSTPYTSTVEFKEISWHQPCCPILDAKSDNYY